MTETTYTSAALFVGKDEVVQAIYTRLRDTRLAQRRVCTWLKE